MAYKKLWMGMLTALLAFSLLLTGCNPGTRAAGTWDIDITSRHPITNVITHYEFRLRITNQGWEFRGITSLEGRLAHVGVASGDIIRWRGSTGALIRGDNGETFAHVELLNQNSMRMRNISLYPLILNRR